MKIISCYWCVRREYVLDIFLAGLIWGWPSLMCEFVDCMCLTFSLLGWSETDQVTCVCEFVVCTYLTNFLLGWSEADWVLCVCAFAGGTYLTFSLLSWSKVDFPCVCMFTEGTCSTFPCCVNLRLTEFYVFARVRRLYVFCHFLFWVEADWVPCVHSPYVLDVVLAGLIWGWLSSVCS